MDLSHQNLKLHICGIIEGGKEGVLDFIDFVLGMQDGLPYSVLNLAPNFVLLQ